MVGHRFVEAAVDTGPRSTRTGSSSSARSAAAPTTGCTSRRCSTARRPTTSRSATPTWYADRRRRARPRRSGRRARHRTARVATTARRTGASRTTHCVLATGSYAVRAADPRHRRAPACSCTARSTTSRRSARGPPAAARGVVVGGGLLGLEAANALRLLGLRHHGRRVRAAPDGRAARRRRRRARCAARSRRSASTVRTGAAATAVRTGADGAARRPRASPTASRPRRRPRRVRRRHPPRDQLARDAGLAIGERGGVVVDDALRDLGARRLRDRRGRLPRAAGCTASSPPATRWPTSSPTGSPAATPTFTGADLSTTLKLLGVEVAVRRRPARRRRRGRASPTRSPGRWQKVDRSTPTARCSAPCSSATRRRSRRSCSALRGTVADARPIAAATARRRGRRRRPADLPDAAGVCSCHNVDRRRDPRRGPRGQLEDVAAHQGVHQGRHRLRLVRPAARRSCSTTSCAPAGKAVVKRLCQHFAMTRPELFEVVRVTGIRTLRRAGRAPRHRAAAARSASRRWRRCSPRWRRGYILDGEQASLQDTNDHFLANLQRDGTYSVVPRVPGRRDHARAAHRHRRGRPRLRPLHEDHRRPAHRPVRRHASTSCPPIWARLIDAGFESGHAYGKAVRTVKSCVGIDVVPLRRAGLRAAGHRPRAALPGPAGAAQDQAGRVGLRPRVRRGAEQGRRRHRHRAGLEPLRRRQRRHAPRARRAARRGPRHRDADPRHRPLPHVVRPHRRPARAHRHLAAQARRAASTSCGGS